jgi:hypothetical protein
MSIETLKYIADSPPAEAGGFREDVVSVAKWALQKITLLQLELVAANERYSQAAESYAGICHTLAESGEKRQQLEQDLAAERAALNVVQQCRIDAAVEGSEWKSRALKAEHELAVARALLREACNYLEATRTHSTFWFGWSRKAKAAGGAE